jgi:hypothetical protein
MTSADRDRANESGRIRDWASERRIPCPERGPIPDLVRQAYALAQNYQSDTFGQVAAQRKSLYGSESAPL